MPNKGILGLRRDLIRVYRVRAADRMLARPVSSSSIGRWEPPGKPLERAEQTRTQRQHGLTYIEGTRPNSAAAGSPVKSWPVGHYQKAPPLTLSIYYFSRPDEWDGLTDVRTD